VEPVGGGIRRPGPAQLAAAEPAWGIWNIAEAQAGVLPADLDGRDSIELGCGTGYVSAWLARRGARPVGLDNSAAQLATARQLQKRRLSDKRTTDRIHKRSTAQLRVTGLSIFPSPSYVGVAMIDLHGAMTGKPAREVPAAEVRHAEITIVGGGAIGCAVAYVLTSAGNPDIQS